MVYGASFENWWAQVRMGSNPIPSAFCSKKTDTNVIFVMYKNKIIIRLTIVLSILMLCYIPYFIKAIKIYNSEKNDKKREKLYIQRNEANSFEQCEDISNKILKLGPECSISFDSLLCIGPEQFYLNGMASCIGNLAVKQNNQSLCSNKKINTEVCMKDKFFKSRMSLSECLDSVEEICLLEFVSKANRNTIIDVDCNSFKENYNKDDCFKYIDLWKKSLI